MLLTHHISTMVCFWDISPHSHNDVHFIRSRILNTGENTEGATELTSHTEVHQHKLSLWGIEGQSARGIELLLYCCTNGYVFVFVIRIVVVGVVVVVSTLTKYI
jgi:hypothetical protein